MVWLRLTALPLGPAEPWRGPGMSQGCFGVGLGICGGSSAPFCTLTLGTAFPAPWPSEHPSLHGWAVLGRAGGSALSLGSPPARVPLAPRAAAGLLRFPPRMAGLRCRNCMLRSWWSSRSQALDFTPKYVAESVQLLITTTGFCKKGPKSEKKKNKKSMY